MKLTVKELQISMQEQIDMMKTQLQKSKHEEYELHERVDSLLLNLDAFRKETAFNFREVRAEMAEFRSELTELKSDVAELKSDVAVLKSDVAVLKSDVAVLKSQFAELRSDVSSLITSMGLLRDEMRGGVSAILGYVGRIDKDHEVRIAALEARNPY